MDTYIGSPSEGSPYRPLCFAALLLIDAIVVAAVTLWF